MIAQRSLFTLLLLAAFLVPRGLRISMGDCAPAVTPIATSLMADHRSGPAVPNDCRSHHSGDSLPGGMQHCPPSLDCASAPALAGEQQHRMEPSKAIAVRPLVSVLPPSASPEPHAPPPRA